MADVANFNFQDGRSHLNAAKLKVKFQKQADGTWKIKHFQTQNIFSRPVSHWHSEAELPVPSGMTQDIFKRTIDMNSIIPTHNIGIDYDALVKVTVPILLYKDERIFDEEMEKSFIALGCGLRMPAKFQPEAIKPLISVNSLL